MIRPEGRAAKKVAAKITKTTEAVPKSGWSKISNIGTALRIENANVFFQLIWPMCSERIFAPKMAAINLKISPG